MVRDGSIFLQSMVWTVLTYNPVRVFGILGLMGVVLALAIGIGLVVTRLSGITTLGPWGVTALYAALVMGITGISVFALGSTFNYLVSLFYRQPIRQGLFGKPLFTPSIDHHFGWMGAFALLGGLAIGGLSVALGIGGWAISRLWLYLLGSAMFILVGVQLILYWILMRVLEELSQREALMKEDLAGSAGSPATEGKYQPELVS
jgi:hypothetical protein